MKKADLTIDVDLLSPEAVRDPYPQYIWLREHAPVHWNERLGAWVLTHYDDVRAAFRDMRLSSDRVSPVYAKRRQRDEDATAARVGAILSRWIVFNDPPAHTRLRKLVEYAEKLGRDHGLDRLFVLSTQTFKWFQSKAGFCEGTLDDLPAARRVSAAESGRKSKVLLKSLE